MMEKVFNHTAHRELWDWCVDNPESDKDEWPGWDENEDLTENQCFACDYNGGCSGNEFPGCPLVWPHEKPCWCNGLYSKWSRAFGKQRSEIAAQIRDLPVREGVKCI